MDRSRISCVALGLLLVLATGSPATGDDALEAAEGAFASGDYLTAYRTARRVLKKESGNALAHYIAGAAGLMLDEADIRKGQAEKYLERALELEPGLPGVNYLLGRHRFQQARELDGDKSRKASTLYSEAALRFEKELAVSPGFAKAVEGLALALAGIPEPERAIKAHEVWIEASPAATEAYRSLARVLIAAGRYDEAVAQLDRFPAGSAAVASEASYEMALEMFRFDRDGHAAGAIQSLAERSTEDWHRHALLFLARARQKRTAEATEELLLFLDSDPPPAAKRSLTDVYVEYTLTDLRDAEPDPDDGGVPERIADSYISPVYPHLARKAKIEARVRMLCVVRRDGTILVIHATCNRPGLEFEEAAIEAVERWRYRPATEDGEPVDAVISVIVEFGLT